MVKMIFAINHVGTIDVNMEKIKLRSYLSPGTKFNSNWSTDLNVKGKIFNFWKSIFENVFLNQSWKEFLTKKQKHKTSGKH